MPERPPDPALEASTNRWMRWGLVLMAVMVLAFPAYRWFEPERRADAAEEHRAELAARGGELFALTCAGCHGEEGSGGASAPTLNAREFLQTSADEQIASLIATGVPGTPMSAYSLDFGGPLTLEQIEALTTYLRSLEPDAPSVPDWLAGGQPGGSVTTTTLPAETEPGEGDGEPGQDDGEPGDGDGEPGAGAEQGAEVYAANCAACHGAGLEGGIGPALGAGSGAAAMTDEDLIGVITGGEGAMPAFGSTLTADEIAGAVAFLRLAQESG